MSPTRARAAATNCLHLALPIRCARKAAPLYIHRKQNGKAYGPGEGRNAPTAPRQIMSTIPKRKAGKPIGRWNAIQAELNSGINQATYTKLTKEFADAEAVVEIEALRAAEHGARRSRGDAADPKTDKEMGRWRAPSWRRSSRASRSSSRSCDLLLPKDAADEKHRHPRSARRHRRRRGGAVRRRPVPHVPALCRAARLAGRDHLPIVGERPRRLQGNHRRRSPARACSRG